MQSKNTNNLDNFVESQLKKKITFMESVRGSKKFVRIENFVRKEIFCSKTAGACFKRVKVSFILPGLGVIMLTINISQITNARNPY